MSNGYDRHVRAVQELKEAEEAYREADHEKMGNASSRCVELDPSLGRAWELLGLYHVITGEVGEGRRSFNISLEKRGSFHISKLVLSMMELDEWPGGAEPEDRMDQLLIMGQTFISEMVWPAAALCYLALEREVRSDWRVYSILGLVHREMGFLVPSLKYYDMAVKESGAPDEVGHDRSVVLFKLGRFREAEEAFLAVVDRIPPTPMIWNNIGAAQEAQGKDEEALLSYRKAVRIKDDYYPSIYSIGRLLQKKDRMEEAREYMDRALDIEGRVYDVDDVKGREERGRDGDIHVKEVMTDRET
ncbi:MAG: tetratricopeptide repeat protein [Candidatus Thermoplasmatota archaeon]|nr:tetratricopeptide repeat protein [Candidatus Thermoplasmatota archaeon]